MTRILIALGLTLMLGACTQQASTQGFADVTPSAAPISDAADLRPTQIMQGFSY
ncbi:MAG: hypothetical protein AAFQ36_12655 [Pseudomonadota bacterium]